MKISGKVHYVTQLSTIENNSFSEEKIIIYILLVTVNTNFDPSSDAVDNYAFKSTDFFKNLFEGRMKRDPEFQAKYKNF